MILNNLKIQIFHFSYQLTRHVCSQQAATFGYSEQAPSIKSETLTEILFLGEYMSEKITFELSDKDKSIYVNKVNKITAKDEINVKTKFGNKLQEFEKYLKNSNYIPHFISSLVSDVKFLYEMLCDENYILAPETKKWIIFGLGYFISPVDAIPDFIPVIGYMDDAVIIMWVCHKLKEEIQNYKISKIN
jgi:uncharacterized membrane protein YkvA (DUF1232 family)